MKLLVGCGSTSDGVVVVVRSVRNSNYLVRVKEQGESNYIGLNLQD